jgi:1,5-anhydro-D-fructose reductase (1,5-anhydro-D-mannitol-forming)
MTTHWALLGPGRHAERSIVPALKTAAGSALAAVLSRDRARGETFAAKHGIGTVHTSFEEVLRDGGIDAIYDATPDGLHARHAIAAAAAGKHALIEKPLATSIDECVAAIAAARRHGTRLGVVFNQRHEPAHQEARRLVLSGEIGDIIMAHVHIAMRMTMPVNPQAPPSWRTDPALRPGGILWSIGDHAFDTLAYIVGQEIVEVAAVTDATQREQPDERSAGLLLKLSKGAIGYAATSSKAPFSRRPFEIHGTKGSILIENSFAYLTGAGADPRPSLTLINEGGTTLRHFDPTDCFRLEIEQFARAIAGQGEPMTPADQGLRILATSQALYAAWRDGRVARVSDFMPKTA